MNLDSIPVTVQNQDEFWTELEEILNLPASLTLIELDNTLKMAISLMAKYHDDYMVSPGENTHAFQLLLRSDLFRYHSARMTGILMSEGEENTNPHTLYIIFQLLLMYGHRHHSLFRSHHKWRRLLRGLEDIFSAEVDEAARDSNDLQPIEARLRLPAVRLMYEVCRVQKLKSEELDGISDVFIDRLFDLVETSRNYDEDLNYAVIRLIIALNEQFMVSSARHDLEKGQEQKSPATMDGSLLAPIPSTTQAATLLSPPPASNLPASMRSPSPLDPATRNHQRAHSNSHPPPRLGVESSTGYEFDRSREYHAGQEGKEKEREKQREKDVEASKGKNRVLSVLMGRLGNSKTFGENVIFMLNRCQNTPDELCVQLLILKILYLLFTTAGTQDYFYTNDLRVLVDVFLRELVDLPDESASCRHTYLRVLHPLLTNTQLKEQPYKHPQVRLVLLSLTSHSHIREVDPTLKRLVERCLNADWGEGAGYGIMVKGLVHQPGTGAGEQNDVDDRDELVGTVIETVKANAVETADAGPSKPKSKVGLFRKLGGRSQSAEDMQKLHKTHLNVLSVETNASTLSLHCVAAAAPPVPNRSKKKGMSAPHLGSCHSSRVSESGLSDGGSTMNGIGEEDLVASPTQYESEATGSGGRSRFGLGRRKPPAVPDRTAKPGKGHGLLCKGHPDNPKESGTAWSSDLETEEPGPIKEEEKKEKHSLGFAALAQALQEAGRSRSISKRGHGEQMQGRSPSRRNEKQEVEPVGTPEIVVEGADGERDGQRTGQGRWYQATGWTTFA